MDNNKAIILGLGALVTAFVGYNAWLAKAEQQKEKKKTLYERLGGEAAVNLAVDVFYKKVLADPRINYFFKDTNMAKQHLKQKGFMTMAFGGPVSAYKGKSMDAAHRRLVREMGMNDSHFDAVAENLNNTLREIGVPDDLRGEVMSAVGGLREQVMCRGKWAMESEEEKKQSLYERLGGEAAVNLAVDVFYKKVLADPRINYFFKDTNMASQHLKQKGFMTMAFGGPVSAYKGKSMDAAHRRLVKDMGMNDSHFDAVAENLNNTLREINVPDDLRGEVMSAVGGLREQVMCRGKWA